MAVDRCNHCGFDLSREQDKCPNCGTPLVQDNEDGTTMRFIVWFVIVVVFCLAMILILPR